MDNNCPQEGQQLERVATTHMTIQIAESNVLGNSRNGVWSGNQPSWCCPGPNPMQTAFV